MFYYLRPDLTINAYQAVGPTVVGAVETDYDPQWLCDGQPGRPVRTTGGSASFTVTFPAQNIDFVGIWNHNIAEGVNINITGAITATLGSGGPFKNPYTRLASPVVGSSITIALSGNPVPVVIGELVIGRSMMTERPMQPGGRRSYFRRNETREGTYNSLAVYDYGVRAKTFDWQTTCTQPGLDDFELWYELCKDQAMFTAVVPDLNLPDFNVVQFKQYNYVRRGQWWYEVSVQFDETRVRW